MREVTGECKYNGECEYRNPERADNYVNGWISVEDRLPDWHEWVMCWSKWSKTPLMLRRVETGEKDESGESKWKWDCSKYVGLIEIGIQYWTPLPEPPEDMG